MTNPIQLTIHMPFSYWMKRDPATGVALLRPDARKVQVYVKALLLEIESLAPDLETYTVDSVVFSGGYMSLLDGDAFAELVAALHRRMNLAPDTEISGTLFPGSVDMALLGRYKNYNIGALMFEVPSLLARECEAMRLPNTMEAMHHTLNLLQSYQYGQFGLVVPIGMPGRDEGVWNHLLSEMYRIGGAHIAFWDVSGGQVREHPALLSVQQKLLERGMRQAAPGFYTFAGQAPRFAQRGREVAGIGVGAISRLDGFTTRNTADINAYLAHCNDYRRLIVSAREI